MAGVPPADRTGARKAGGEVAERHAVELRKLSTEYYKLGVKVDESAKSRAGAQGGYGFTPPPANLPAGGAPEKREQAPKPGVKGKAETDNETKKVMFSFAKKKLTLQARGSKTGSIAVRRPIFGT